jgi:hypothetical protein
MTKALLKSAFVMIVIVLTIIFLIPAQVVLEFFWPTERGDRLLPGLIVVFACAWAANRLTSFLFWNTHLSDERWSLLGDRRRRRPG